MMTDRSSLSSRREQFQELLPYLALCLLIWGFYFFFCEHLPWFWYDDISVLERSEATSFLDNVSGILNFAPKHYYIDNRPVLIVFSKLCRALVGDDPGYHRALKLMAYAMPMVLLLRLLYREGVEKKFSIMLLLLFSTLPPVFIVNAWIYEAETFELLFKVASFGIFWSCITSDGKPSAEKFMKCVLLVLLVVIADKTKAPAKVIPVLFLFFLAIIRSKDTMLYGASLVSLAAVFPYGMVSGGTGALAAGAASGLLKTFVTQLWGVLALTVFSVVVARRTIFKRRLFVFALLWLGCELLFMRVFPSTEMRYLYSSMAAACLLAAVCLSHCAVVLQEKTSRRVFSSGVLIMLCIVIATNTYWIYNFRASFCSKFIIADKMMTFINDNFRNSLFFYNNNARFYYDRKTSNRYVSVPLYEKETRMSFASEIYKQYEYVLADMESASMLMTDNKLKFNVLDEFSSDSNALFDRIQSVIKVRTKNASLYDNNLRMLSRYPDVQPLYLMESSAQAAGSHQWSK